MKNALMVMTAAGLLLGLPFFHARAKADLIVTEIMYNPASNTDSHWEYVEIYNTSASETVNLAGYVLDDDDGGRLSSANIPAGNLAPLSTAVLFNAQNNTLAQMQAAWGSDINFVEVTNWSALADNSDRIGLWDSLAGYDRRNFTNAIIDVRYRDTGDWPADDNKSSIYLIDLDSDPSLGTNWALSSVGDASGGWESNPAGTNNKTNIGSPGGTPPPAPVPEPATLSLLMLGGLLAILRRRTP